MDNDDPAPKTLTDAQAWVAAVCDVTGWNCKLNGPRAAKLAKRLREAGGTVADLREHFGQEDVGAAWWYYRDAWQGQRGQRPTQSNITEYWDAWALPIAVQPQSAVGQMLAHIAEQEQEHVYTARN